MHIVVLAFLSQCEASRCFLPLCLLTMVNVFCGVTLDVVGKVENN